LGFEGFGDRPFPSGQIAFSANDGRIRGVVNSVKCQDDQRKNGNAIPFLISTQFILFAWMRSEIEMRENGFIFSFQGGQICYLRKAPQTSTTIPMEMWRAKLCNLAQDSLKFVTLF
jgi:hypothetical protein